MRVDPKSQRCREVKTMEHLLCECIHYSQLICICLNNVITLFELSFSRLHPKSGDQSSQCNLQCPLPKTATLYSWQTCQKCSLHPHTRNQTQHQLQTYELAAIRKVGDKVTKADSQSLFNYLQTPLLLSIYLFGKVWQSNFSTSNNVRTYSWMSLTIGHGNASSFPPA
jgi:hypothetical protein